MWIYVAVAEKLEIFTVYNLSLWILSEIIFHEFNLPMRRSCNCTRRRVRQPNSWLRNGSQNILTKKKSVFRFGSLQIWDQTWAAKLGILTAYSTVWNFSNFPATLVLIEFNFGWFQRVKNCRFTNLEGFKFCLEKFHIWKCQKFPKFKAAQQNDSFCGTSKWPKLISCKIWVTEKSWNFHIGSYHLPPF